MSTAAKRAQSQSDRGPEDQFAGSAVRAGENALHDGQDQQRQQHVGRVVVDRPQQPSAGDLVLEEVTLSQAVCALGL